MPVKFQSDAIMITHELAASRLHEILRQDVRPLSEKGLRLQLHALSCNGGLMFHTNTSSVIRSHEEPFGMSRVKSFILQLMKTAKNGVNGVSAAKPVVLALTPVSASADYQRTYGRPSRRHDWGRHVVCRTLRTNYFRCGTGMCPYHRSHMPLGVVRINHVMVRVLYKQGLNHRLVHAIWVILYQHQQLVWRKMY